MQPDIPMARLMAKMSASTRRHTGVHLPCGVLPVYSNVFGNRVGMLLEARDFRMRRGGRRKQAIEPRGQDVCCASVCPMLS